MDSPEERQPPDVITSDTDNATKIQPKEAPPGKRAKFRRFRAYNTDMWNGPRRENTEQFRRQDNLHRYDSIASSLNLNDYQKSRGRKVLDDIKVNLLGIEVDSIIFGICTLVANKDVDNGTRYWPQHPDQERTDNDGRFEEVADSLNLGWKKQMSIIKKVQSRVDI
jgi:hypothetical protein